MYWIWGFFPPSLSFLIIEKNRVSFTKPIEVLIILEYSTIFLLDYFQQTLAYAVLPEYWLEWYLNDITQIKNKCMQKE